MILKTHTHADGRLIVCVTDSELIGQVFEEGNKQLDCASEFIKGKEAPDEDIIEYFSKAAILMLNGKNSIDLAQKNGVEIVRVHEIKGVPYAQVVQG